LQKNRTPLVSFEIFLVTLDRATGFEFGTLIDQVSTNQPYRKLTFIPKWGVA